MNDKIKRKLQKFFKKNNVTQEEINSLFANNDINDEEDDDLLNDEEEKEQEVETKQTEEQPTTSNEENKETKVDETKVEDKVETKTDVEPTPTNSVENPSQTEAPNTNAQNQQPNPMDEILKALQGFNSRIDSLEEKMNAYKDFSDSNPKEEDKDFGKSGDQQGKGEDVSNVSFDYFAGQLGRK